jgi:superfamily I DNA and/or RNA helicase
VILVLGAPNASQNGARSWAAGTPNILNVAVSRAKQDFYVIGSRGAWSGVGHGRELASSLQTVRI